jgi:hypothetical protein
MFAKRISFWKSLQFQVVKFRKTKNGETRNTKSKAKYRLQMLWVMVTNPASPE